jgi:hypothetical protein
LKRPAGRFKIIKLLMQTNEEIKRIKRVKLVASFSGKKWIKQGLFFGLIMLVFYTLTTAFSNEGLNNHKTFFDFYTYMGYRWAGIWHFM